MSNLNSTGISISIKGIGKVGESLNKANKILESASDSISSLSIPGDFVYSGQIRRSPSKIKEITRNIKSIKNEMEQIIRRFKVAEKLSGEALEAYLKSMNIFSAASSSKVQTNNSGNEIEQNASSYEEFLNNIKDMSKAEFFLYCAKGNNNINCGVDQGIFNYLSNKDCDPEYFESIKNGLMDQYKMSSKDATKVMNLMDSLGACTYATATNNIVAQFKDKPKEFEKIFGFPLYRKTKYGYTTNVERLYADMFVQINTR